MKTEYVALSEMQWKKIQDAMIASRKYVECCCEPNRKDEAAAALRLLDKSIGLKPTSNRRL